MRCKAIDQNSNCGCDRYTILHLDSLLKVVYINTLNYTQRVITQSLKANGEQFFKRTWTNEINKEFEFKAKSVCSGRKWSQRAQSGGMTKSHSSTGHNENSFTEPLEDGKKKKKEEILPLGPLSGAASQNFIQPPDSATLVISYWDWWFLDCSSRKVWSASMVRFLRDRIESTELEGIFISNIRGVQELQEMTLLHKWDWFHIECGEGSVDFRWQCVDIPSGNPVKQRQLWTEAATSHQRAS